MPTSSPPHPSSRPRKLLSAVLATVAFMSFLLLGATGPAEASEPAPTAGKAEFEVMFMKDMSMHHHMAVMMAAICSGRDDLRTELRELCDQISVAQSDEIGDMTTWLSEWYGIEYDPMAEMDPDEMAEMMTEWVNMPAAEFEQFFLTDMISHHRGALRPARQCQAKASHRELKQLCTAIVRTQPLEVRQMQRFLCQWYDTCGYRGDPNGGMHGMHGMAG